jgi:gamma-glutamyltranspeptidase
VVVWQTPPPTQGLTLLQTLGLLEGFDLPALGLHSAEHVHLLVEALKVAYADRDRWVADPERVEVPVADLLDPAYLAGRRRLIGPSAARDAASAGDPTGDTTGFVVADRTGGVIAVIQSLYSGFGSGVVAPGTGFALHNRGAGFSLDPASPNVLAPGKQPFHTLIAALLTRDGRPAGALATMGAHGQPQTHVQVLTNLIDFGQDPQEAIERPRFVQGRMRPTDRADRLRLESRLPPATVATLREWGHLVELTDEWSFVMGQAHALTAGAPGGEPADATVDPHPLVGGADPRGDGVALGY